MRNLILGLLAATMLAGPALADNRRDARSERRNDQREWQHDRRDARADRRDWYQDRRQWRPVGRNDWRWAGPRFRGQGYVYPRGFAYRPWGVGYRLPPAYFARPFWVADPFAYRLPRPYRGARWVRVGPDALMIRIGGGFVLQAVRGLWW